MKKLFILWGIILCAVMIGSYLLFEKSSHLLQQEELTQLKQQMQQAAWQCYALEGRYPKTLEELTDRYDIHVQLDMYTVFYTYNGDNLLPDIEIMRKK